MLDGIVLLPALAFFHKFGKAPEVKRIMILGFSTASTMIEIPFTSMIQLFLCLIAY